MNEAETFFADTRPTEGPTETPSRQRREGGKNLRVGMR